MSFWLRRILLSNTSRHRQENHGSHSWERHRRDAVYHPNLRGAVSGACMFGRIGDTIGKWSRFEAVRATRMIYPTHSTRLLRQRPAFLGVATAVLFFCASLVPGLLPLSWQTQGIISGFWMAVGYGLGTSVSSLFCKMVCLRPSTAIQTVAWAILLVLGSILSGWSLIAAYQWQVDVRKLMGMSTAILHYPAAFVFVATLVAVILVLLARLVRAGYRQYITIVSRYFPRVGAHAVALGVITTVLLVVFITDNVIGEQLFPALDRRYIAADVGYDRDIRQPSSPYKSGGAGSLVSWETLGIYGRTFVTQGPSVTELTRFSGKASREPIRIYVGRQSAGSVTQRAELAVAELERTGAFRRKLLVIVTPTGTGWIDPYAVAPLEYMYAGNTAAVALQYSYLPSWIVMIGRQHVAHDVSKVLIAAVSERLEREPEATRPRLLIYGQSLGVFASERAFTGLDDVRQQTDGALLVGPPSVSRLWREFVVNRDKGSPIWKPVYNGGETVRFGFDLHSLTEPQSRWDEPRVVYLQHASDPIPWWSPGMLLRRPAWMEEPLGPDISKKMKFYPVATFLRVTVDLMLGLGAPPGHGHRYGASQAEAWTLIVPPEGWASHDTKRLITAIEAQN